MLSGSIPQIVTEATARRLWPSLEPIGQTITTVASDMTFDFRVVGVAKDAPINGIGETPSAYMYLPAGPASRAQLQLLARSRVDFTATAAAIRAAAAELDPALVVGVTPLEANLDTWRSLSKLVGAVSTSLGVLALALASVGVYGVVAHVVGRRIREMGIRLALGASGWGVLALILRRTMPPIVIGAAIGIAMAVGVSRVLSSVLFGVSPTDAVGLGGAALFVFAVALAASLLAARPATRADPMIALRYE